MTKQRICRTLMVLGLLAASAGVQAMASMQAPADGAATPTAQRESTSQMVLRWLRVNDGKSSFYGRVIGLSSSCLLGVWFLAGGIPKRRTSGLTLVEPARSERVKVIDGPAFEGRSNPVFLQAFPVEEVESEPWQTSGEDASVAIEATGQTGSEARVQMARGFVQQWIVAADREALEAPMDSELLAEVENYARQLLGRSPGLSESTFDRMMAAAIAAVDATRSPVDKDEPILCELLPYLPMEPSEENEVPAWVDQEEPILCEVWGMTPEPESDEDILGLSELEHLNLQVGDEPALEIEPTNGNGTRSVRTAATPPELETSSGPLFDQRIIILGESQAVLEIEKRIVISAGARVITFRRWDEALKFADEKDFDLLLINGMTEDGWSVGKLHDWMAKNRPGWEKRSAFALSAPDADADEFAARTAAWCIVHPFGPKELVSFLQAVLMPTDEKMVM